MLTLGSLSFLSPWLLAALAVLPVLWWLLRLIPPAPRRQTFPAIRLLLDLMPREETPERTPPWLLALRLLLAALIILALARPILDAPPQLSADGPLVLVVDDGWAAAPDWSQRLEALEALVDQAERESVPVAVLSTAPPADGDPIAASDLMPAGDARGLVQSMRPKPWASDRGAAADALRALDIDGYANMFWLADGLAGDADADRDFVAELQRRGRLTVLAEAEESLPLLQLPPATQADALVLRLARAGSAGGRSATLRATAEDGRTLAVERVEFAPGERSAEQEIELPIEIRNRITRISVEGHDSAGATVLLDERWRQRPVGIVPGGPQHDAQPLLSNLYYLERALEPVGEIREGDVLPLLERELAVLVLADVGTLTGPERDRVDSWVRDGGVLLRFAGPRLAQNADALLPVRLRAGDRVLGGVMSWSEPAKLAPFPADGPFQGLKVPNDVVVQRQVLAEPDPDLGRRTWARLADGTPLVTGERHGDGWLVLVHTTANADWSNLALSGLFVEMLQRVVGLSQGVAGTREVEGERLLPPYQVLDGFGRLGEPPATAVPAPLEAIAAGRADPRHPPGFYGSETTRIALNLSAGLEEIRPLGPLPGGTVREPLARAEAFDLMPWLLAAALLLLIVDLAVALLLRGLFPAKISGRWSRAGGTAAMLAIALPVLAGGGPEAAAQEPGSDEFAIAALADTRLAYVRTGMPEVDATSRAGLQGLSLILNQRTSVEALPPMGVDIETDDLSFFPLLYWPVTPEQPMPSPGALSRVNEYLRNGGSVLFDTRDRGMPTGLGAASPATDRLRELARGLDVPPLAVVPPDHVLTKSFYLMQDFPGRWAGGEVWVDAEEDRANDGVSSVIIGGNDWAAAWAIDDSGRALFPVVPDGERQREMAYRFGVNLVMYVLTGNYKSDQVHVPAILERLGQ
ncbi:MAG: LytTR family transcriptional regulator [Alphaproteobacteria bacterium]|nr:MAG: LytTR family transcriptional regulator [Alphaproteobacteria bacterium]